MKRNMLVFMAALTSLALAGQARAATTDTITVTVSLAEVISVAVTPSAWNIGPITLGTVHGPTSFTATVGNSATRLEIVGSDGAGGWTLGGTAGLNRFVVTVANPALTLSKVYQVLAASAPAYGSHSFTLTYGVPTQDNKGGAVSQSFAVTLRASTPIP